MNAIPNLTVKWSLSKRVEPAFIGNLLPPFKKSDVYKYLNGTSDHTWKTYKINISEEEAIKIGTWNLMDRCVKTRDLAPSNNPINCEETYDAYFLRKYVQIDEIRCLLNSLNLDAFALQEIDFYFKPISTYERQFLKSSEYNLLNKVRMRFLEMINQRGWKIISTNENSPKKNQNPLLIIYNPQKIMTEQVNLTPCFQQKNHLNAYQFRGGEALFTSNKLKQIVIANLHLNYEVLPQEQIETYQNEKIAKKIPAIAIGDLNRPPNRNLFSSICNKDYPSTIDSADRNDPKTLSTREQTGDQLEKAYDSACVSSGAEEVVCTEAEIAHFKQVNDRHKWFYGNINNKYTIKPKSAWKKEIEQNS